MFLDDLESAERLLRENPEAGIRYADHESGAIRRVLLSQTEYHLYYRYRRDRDELIVLKVHGATRKHGPRF
jgi:plasmid stabilization system protein ParE